jgi:hypothetical protein
MPYLICDECGGYYELQEWESPDDFDIKCNCGGNLRFSDINDIIGISMNDVSITNICPVCGLKNTEGSIYCASCDYSLNGRKYQSKKILKGWWDDRSIIGKLGVLFMCFGIFIFVFGTLGSFGNNSQVVSNNVSTSDSNLRAIYSNNAYDIEGEAENAMADVSNTSKSILNGNIDQNTAISHLQNDKQTIDTSISQLQGLNPPANMQNINSLTISGFQDYSNAIGLEISGVQNNDTNDVSLGGNLMKNGDAKLEEATKEIKQLN